MKTNLDLSCNMMVKVHADQSRPLLYMMVKVHVDQSGPLLYHDGEGTC